MTKLINIHILSMLVLIQSVYAWCQINKFLDFGPVIALDYSPDNTMILTVTTTKLTIWQRITKRIIFTRDVTSPHQAKFSRNVPSSYIAISRNGSLIELISGVSPFGTIQTFNAGHGGTEAVGVDFTSNTVLLTCGGQTNKVKLWDISVNPANNLMTSSVAQMQICGYSSSTRIGTATSNNKLYYNAISGTSITNLITINANSCKQIAFSPDGTQMTAACSSASGVSAYFITVSPASTQTGILTTGNMYTTSYAGDGNTCCYGGDTNKLFIVNATAANKTILSEFVTTSNIRTSDFTNDGSYLLAGTQDGTVYEYAKYCLDCTPGYYSNLTTKTCILCETTMKGCSNCHNSTHCIQCYQNFIYNATSFRCMGCSGLMDGCGTCLNATTCRYCMIGYYMLTNFTCAKCEAVLTGCYACNSSAHCFQCQSDFYLASNNTCIGCQINNPLCIKCVNTSYCTTCKVGYYQSSGVCTPCATNCYICQSATNCTDCLTGYYPLSSGGSVTCTKCSTGCLACNATDYCRNCDDQRYLIGGVCNLCPYPCATCNASNYCLSCESAHFYNGAGSCTQCTSGCASCNSSSICLSCSVGYYLEILNNTCMECQLKVTNCMQCTNTTCLFCQVGYYLSAVNTCSRCTGAMFACAGCSGPTICDFCTSGYYKSSGTGNLSCQVCVLGCATCISVTNCTSCNVGYYLDTAAATCNQCINNCVTCTNTTYCLQCQTGYSLGTGGSCISCSLNLTNCQSCTFNFATSSLWCLSCAQNTYIDSITGTCMSCPINCTTCYSASACQSCQVGSYLDSGSVCRACHSNCSQCTGSWSNCSSCVAGYYVTSGYRCQHCSIFGCLTCNSTTFDCISCQIGYYLKTVTGPPTIICDNCLSAIPNCYICTSPTICKQCAYGYALATNQLSCTACSVVEGCKHCTSISSCENCQIGYYLVVNGSGIGICSRCSVGCKECDLVGVCLLCFSEYSKQTISGVVTCILCQFNITGCLVCTNSSQCTNCLPGYYIDTATYSCKLCTATIFACQYCNSSTTCTRCQDGYYVNSTNLCQRCQSAITGCRICNTSTVCLACQFGMYLHSNLCYKCSVNLPNCLYCQNLTTCLQCDAGSYLNSTLGTCMDCQARISGCVQCSSGSNCLQCKGGYYLNTTTNLCSPCNHPGCEVCVQTDPLLCVKCNSRYYMNSTLGTCIKCRQQIDGCLQCTSSTTCSQCDPGYFANSTSECQLCQSVISGCGRCLTSSICLECKSTYYLNSTFKCQECKLDLPGCSFCINNTACQSCYHGYYMTTAQTCQTCTTIAGCLSCINQTYCQYCQKSYFLQPTQNTCYPCSVLVGCYACTTNITCSICMGGYILNDEQICQVMKVQATERVKDLKLVTKYVNVSCLVHYLYAKSMTYNKSDNIDWNRTTKLILQDEQYQQTNLIILKVQWTNSYTLTFYTDNPLKISQPEFPLAGRRLLLSPLMLTPKYKINLKMNQSTINQILPQFYLPKDLVMDYDLTSGQFVNSYLSSNTKLGLYSVFGYVITCVVVVGYVMKASCSAPGSAQMGDIIPQVLALKCPAFFLYPGYIQWVYYCIGFTIPDFPWLNPYFGSTLADTSNLVPEPFSLFFANLHIGSTYLLALLVILLVIFVLGLLYKNKQRQYQERFPIGNVFFYVFLFGGTWASCLSLQGGIYNPIQIIDINSGFYMIGIALYCSICGICMYRIYKAWTNLSQMRIVVKATLLSLAHISPIYIFFSSVLVDVILVILEHNFIKNNRLYPRLWIVKNVLCNLALCVLSIWTSALASLIITSILVTAAVFLDIYTHAKQYQQRYNKRKLKLENTSHANQSQIDVNIWNINFQKQADKIKQFSKQQQQQQQLQFQNQGRKTAFDGTKTRATNFTYPKRKNILETHKKLRKARNQTRPDIVNVTDSKVIEKDSVEDLENNMQLFIAKTNME